METEIYDLIKKIVYEQSINKLIDEKAEFFEYPIKIEKITFDVLDIFNNLYYDKYKDCLLHNAAIYAIKTNDEKYIDLFKNNNIDKLINNDRVIKAMITQRAIYNIIPKIKNKINTDDKIKDNNLNLYKKLSRMYNIEMITKKLRKILLSFLNNYNSSDFEILLDIFLTSDKLDDEMITFNNFFNENNLEDYKKLLFAMILSDNYLYLKSTEKDMLFENNDELDEEDEIIRNMDEEIINLLENNDLSQINEYDVRLNLYSNFIVYNILLSEQKQDYENIKTNKDAIKTLKKINPFYFLDLY